MPTISNHRMNELESAERELRDLKEAALLEPFVAEFGEALALAAATTPRADWPRAFHVAWNHVACQMPNAAAILRERWQDFQ